MTVLAEEAEQLVDLCVVCTHRVGTAVGFELKPSEIFVGGGLEGD